MELLNFSDAVHELTDSPQVWESLGMTISAEQAAMLAQHQRTALRDAGRVDFGDGVLKKLVAAFCDSPYIQTNDWADTPKSPAYPSDRSPYIQANDWADTLAQLTELFYTLKNETRDQLGDDALIAAMAARFNGGAGGSLGALGTTEPAWFLCFDKERGAYEF